MKTRCKFQVQSVTKYQGHMEAIKLTAVYDDGVAKENASFASATPSGSLEITVTNVNVIGKLLPGAYYYLDLVPVE
jgi:hypothetical protein